MTEASERVSVAMCTYNGSHFLREQLQSIASQTVRPCEFVVCDDLSTDDSLEILRRFGQQAPFHVRIIQNDTRLGPSKNFEKAIRQCRGEVIFLCDQDDVWMPQKIERILGVLDDHPDSPYAFSNAEMIDEDGNRITGTLWDAVGMSGKLMQFSGAGQLEILLKHNLVTGATMAVRSSFCKLALPIEPGWMHDHWIVLLAASLSNGVPISDCLIRYRRHTSQACGWRKKTFWQVCLDSLRVRGEDWSGKVEQFRKLVERARLMNCPVERMDLLSQKEMHMKTRCETRASNGVVRIAKVLAEAATGRYQRFSDSWYSIVRDL